MLSVLPTPENGKLQPLPQRVDYSTSVSNYLQNSLLPRCVKSIILYHTRAVPEVPDLNLIFKVDNNSTF